jgi:hypothetical protein
MAKPEAEAQVLAGQPATLLLRMVCRAQAAEII